VGKIKLDESINLTSADGGVISVNELARRDWLYKTGNPYSKVKMAANFLRLGPMFLVGIGPWLVLITVATGGLDWVIDPYYVGLFFLVFAFMFQMGNINDFYDRFQDRIASEHYKGAIASKEGAPLVSRVVSDADYSRMKDVMLIICGFAMGLVVWHFGYIKGRWIIVFLFTVALLLDIGYSIFRFKGGDFGLLYTFGMPLWMFLPFFVILGVDKLTVLFYLLIGVLPAWSHACGKDFKDIEADESTGMRTIPMRSLNFAKWNTILFAAIPIPLALLFGPLGEPYGLMLVNNWWFTISLIPVTILAIATIIAFRGGPLSVSARAAGFFGTIMVEFFLLYAFMISVVADEFIVLSMPIASAVLIVLEFVVVMGLVKNMLVEPVPTPTASKVTVPKATV